MRSYSALLVFENVFDSVDPLDQYLAELCDHVFYPSVRIVEDYCHTLLGEEMDVNYEVEGYVELSTGESITRARIEELLSQGQYKVRVRSLSTCTSAGGVCAKCYQSSRQDEPYPVIGETRVVSPLFVKSTDVAVVGQNGTILLTLPESDFDKVIVYCNDNRYSVGDYTLSGNLLQLSDTSIASGSPAVVRYISETRVPFMLWLAGTYSGSLLGVKQLPGPLLPIRSLLLRSQLPEHTIDSLVDVLDSSDSRVPGNMVEYARAIPDTLEKSLFSIALRVIYDVV